MISLDPREACCILCVLGVTICAFLIAGMVRDIKEQARKITERSARNIAEDYYRRMFEILKRRQDEEEKAREEQE